MEKLLRFKKLIAFLCSVLVLFPCIFCVSVNAKEAFPDTSGANYIYLYNFDGDKVVYRKGSNTAKIMPASTVKIMSGLLAIDRLGDRLDEYVTLSDDMLKGVEGFSVGLKAGDNVKIEDLLYCLICGGGNDAAIAIANICSGSVDSFVSEMNTLALKYGMQSTKYLNPTGIDDPQMYTCLNDVVILSKIAIQNELFIKISSTSNYSFSKGNSGEIKNIANRNALISSFSAMGYQNKNVKGLNAGMTDNGGYCVSAYATDGQDTYLCIVMGGRELSNGKISSYSIANGLLEHMFENFTYTQIAKKGDVVDAISVKLALPTNGTEAVYVDCQLENDIYAFAPKNINYKNELTYKTYFHSDSLTAPVYENTVVGGVDIYYEDTYLASARLLTKDSAPSSKLLTVLNKMKSFTLSRTVLIFVILLIPSLSVYFYFTVWKRKLKNRKALREYGKTSNITRKK